MKKHKLQIKTSEDLTKIIESISDEYMELIRKDCIRSLELSENINFWINSIRKVPDDEWQYSECYCQLIDACYKFRKSHEYYHGRCSQMIKKELRSARNNQN